MKKRHLWLLALSLIISICTCFSLAACKDDGGDEITPVVLTVPVVSIDGEGVASWDNVPNASGYAYKINDGEENTTSNCSVTLTDKQSICVKAVGDGENYTDSEWSQAKTYTAPASVQPVKLGKPVVTLNGAVASWNAVEHASGYKYSLDNGTTWVNATGTSVTLTDKQTVIVKAIGDGKNYTDGDASAPVTYNAAASGQHTHNYTWTDNEDGTHSGVCANTDGKCDAPDVTNEEHVYGEDDECVCGAVRPAPGQHTHNYTWTNNNDGTHSGVCANTDGECDAPNVTNRAHVYGANDKCVCGAVKPAPAPGEHTHNYTWTDNEDGTHSGVCANTDGECDAPNVTNRTHEYGENDECVCGAKKPADVPAPDTMTHAQYAAAEKDAEVKVAGIVTAFRNKNVFLMDKDGGYYAYNATTVPSNLAVGMAVTVTGKKAVYNGLDEITRGIIKITNATPVTVTPVDITTALTNATAASDEALLAMQNTYVKFTGVITSNDNGATIKVGEKDYTFYVGGGNQVVTTAQQTAIITAFKGADGKTADVTAIVAVHNGAIQFVPANATPVTVHTKLATPELVLDENTGAVTWTKDANADKYAYKIGDGEISYIEKDETASVTIEDGDEITVWAIGHGPYLTGGEAKKSYNKTPLAAPVVTKAGNSGAKWTAVQGAAKYGYTITKVNGTVVNGETEKTSITLENGSKIVVWAIGTGKYKNSAQSNEFEFEKKAEVTLDEPTFSIDRNGKVTIDEHHDTEIFKYVIGDLEALEEAWVEGTIGTEGLEAATVTGEISVPNGKAIVILAGGYTAEDGTVYKDSDWTEPEEYKAPKGTFADIDAEDVEISLSKEAGKVDVVWLHEDGEKFEIVLNGTPSTLTNSETVLDFKAYDEIKIKVLATEPESGYDYSGCYNASGYLDITDSVNTFVADEKIKVEKTDLENFLQTKVNTDKDITLRTAGATYSDVKITWRIVGGNDSIAWIDSGTLKIRPTANLTKNVIATLKCGTSEDTKEFPIEIKELEVVETEFVFAEIEPFKSFGANRTLTAEEDVIEGPLVTITFDKGTASSAPAWNESEKGIRAYAKNTITISSERKITKIVLTYTKVAGGSNKVIPEINHDGFTEAEIALGDKTATAGTWTGLENEVIFTLTGSAGNFSITSIAITYEKPSDEDLVNAAIKALEKLNFAEQYTENFFVDATVMGLPISWSANPNEGFGSISFSATAENGKYTANVKPSTASDVDVTLTASVTSGSVTKQKTYTVTLTKKIPVAISGKPVVKIGDDGKVTWEAVENAERYVYQLKTGDAQWADGTETIAYNEETQLYSVPTALTDGQSIRVKAVGDGYDYSESDWTERTYTVDGPAHEHSYEWVDNGDGTHKQHCDVDGCDAPDINAGNHEYGDDGKCVCGAVEVKEKTWQLVTDMSQIADGSKIIIASKKDGTGFALSTTQSSNNRGQTTFDKSAPSSDVQILTVRTGTDSTKFVLAIEDEDGTATGYLYAAGGTGKNNYLKTNTAKDAVCDWTISLNTDGSASIVAADTTIARNTMMYNTSSGLFSCYASGQAAIYMYILA